MKEFREYLSILVLLLGVIASAYLISVILAFLYINPKNYLYLLRTLFINIAVLFVCVVSFRMLTDDVWNRQNMPIDKMRKKFRLKK